MSCTFDQELIALYAGGDLPVGEKKAVEEHVAACAACRRMIELHQADAALVAGLSAGIPAPRRRAAPIYSRRWLTAAAAVLLLILFAPQVQAVGARLIELFPFLHVREMNKQELEELNNRPPTGEVHYPTNYASVEEAEKVLGYRIGRLSALPEGFVVKHIQVSFPHQPINSTVIQAWQKEGAILALDQTRSGRITALVEEGSTREVKVKGKRAALVTRAWETDTGTSITRNLYFQWEDQPMTLTVSGRNAGPEQLSDEELIKIAESVR